MTSTYDEASPSLLSPNNRTATAAGSSSSKRGGFSLFRRGHGRKRALRPTNTNNGAGGGDGRSGGAGAGGRGGRLNHTDIILEDGEEESIEVRAAAPTDTNTIFVPRDNAAVGGVGIQSSTRSFSFSPFGHTTTAQHNVGVGTSTTWSDIPQQQQQQQQQLTDDGSNNSVHLLERGLRQIVIGCGMFLAGTQYLGGANMAYRILELSLVAWGTCLFIMIMTWFQRGHTNQQQLQQQQLQQQYLRPMTASTPLINNTTRTTNPVVIHPTERLEDDTDTERSPLRKKRTFHAASVQQSKLFRDISKLTESEGGTVDDNNNQYKYLPQTMNTTEQPTTTTTTQSLHPHLANLYIICDQERIFPNVLVDIDTDFFEGKMLLMFRTPEVDEPMLRSSEDPVVTYFRGKQRRFEFQWQLRLKKLPHGTVFLGVEIDEPVQMGMIQRALANAALKFTKKLNTGFSAELMPDSGPAYLSFPVGTSMDRLNATKVGDALPTLGGEIPEDPEVMKVRKKGTPIEWSMDNVYTMALWSAYADWSEWSIMNFPGIRPFSITSMVGVQPVKLTLYSQKEHEREVIIAMEVSHATLATMGSQAQSWVVRNLDRHDAKPSEVTVDSEIDSYNGNSHVDEADLVEEEQLKLDDPEISSCVLSGSSLSLREGIANHLANGGGYAVLQTSPPPFSFFVLEKVQIKTKKRASDYTTSIRSGDVVRVQLVDATTNDIKYLTIHQGWWLRWSSARPKRNGLFCVRTGETNGARLDFGCPFSLTSWRWSHYTIGACFETSATYGGRMLGIQKTRKVSSVTEDTAWDDEDGQTHVHDNHLLEMSTDKRMTPLLLIAETWEIMPDPISTLARSLFTDRVASLERPGVSSVRAVSVQKRYEVDVLCWLEVMNRTQRKLQLVFAIRFKSIETDAPCLDEENRSIPSNNRMFIKLRTGRDILRLGLNGKESVLSPSSDQRQRFDSSDNQDELNEADSFTSSSDDFDSDDELDGDGNDDDESSKFGGGIYGSDHDLKEDDEWTVAATTEVMQTYPVPAVDERDITLTPNKGNDVGTIKHRSEDLTRHDLIGTESTIKKNMALSVHSVGRAAKSTSKSVIKHSKSITMGTVKGTVSAGRAASRAMPVSSVHIYKPRRHEPSGGKLRRISNKDHRESLKAIKSIEDRGAFATDGLPGQLLPPDQSCRKVSRLLSDAAKAPSSQWAISQLADSNSTQDLAFLRGSSAELGVKPLKQVNPLSDICCLIARCIYEGRWREELCVLYTKDRYLTFYAPLGKYPSLAISFDEITAARVCDEINEFYPLPGLHTLAIDTAWKCHYISFLEIAGRDNFLKCLNDALFFTAIVETKPGRQVASEFDSYRMSLENSLTGTIGKWRTVSISKKSKHKKQRRVLNNRRMSFDVVAIGDTLELIASYVENLLTMALSFSSDTLNASETRFIEFLDEASRLPTLPLHEIDLSSKEALCIFINLYHCLLQHSLLVAVDGLPNKRSCQQFKRCSCYEIGSDVFSLAELECCVIRGQMSRASHIKPPFVDAPKASKPYLIYGVMADHRVNFILNNGDMSYPSQVPVFKQGLLDEQIDQASSRFLMEQIKIDKKKRIVYLPKVCEVYALDFGMGDGLVCISQCVKYLDEDSHSAIAKLLEGAISVRYNPGSQMFHPNLYEDKLVEPPSPDVVSSVD